MGTLDNFKKNVHSQNGEDGVIAEVLRRLGISTGYFVEFGAWDGQHLSNTFHLLEQGWSGVYIEGDKQKYNDLVKNMQPYGERITTIEAFVEPGGPNSLDNLLGRTSLSREFEVLSIDIDSYDWYIWASLANYQPLVVVIEINSSVPVGVMQTHRDERICGSSFSSTLELGQRKGYTLVCHTGNQIFVRSDHVDKIGLAPAEIEFPELLFNYGWIKS